MLEHKEVAGGIVSQCDNTSEIIALDSIPDEAAKASLIWDIICGSSSDRLWRIRFTSDLDFPGRLARTPE